MTTAVATVPANATTRWQPPVMSQALTLAVHRSLNPHPSDYGASVPAHVQAEAAAKLPALEVACKQAGIDRLRRWLLAVNAAVRNPAAPGEPFDIAVAAVSMCADLPAIAMTSATQRLAVLEWEFWPSLKQLHEFLSAQAADVVRQRDALRRIASATVEAQWTPPTDAEREAVASTVAALKASLAAEAEQREAAFRATRPGIAARPARPVDPATLARMYAAARLPDPRAQERA